MSRRSEEFHDRASELEWAARMFQRNPNAREQLMDLARQWRYMADGWTNVFGDSAQSGDDPAPGTKEGRRPPGGQGLKEGTTSDV